MPNRNYKQYKMVTEQVCSPASAHFYEAGGQGKVTGGYPDTDGTLGGELVEMEIYTHFEAASLLQAKREALEVCPDPSGRFIVYDEKGKQVFTNEECE